MASTTSTTRALTAALFTLLAWAATPLTTQAQLPDYLPTDGLVGWWPFNGNANDESGNGNDGVLVGGITLADDRNNDLNSAYHFDGQQLTYIDCGSDALFDIQSGSSITLSAWVKPNYTGNVNQGVVSKASNMTTNTYGTYSLSLIDGIPRFVVTNENAVPSWYSIVTGSDPLPVDTWNHIVCVADFFNSEIRIYVNGEIQSSSFWIGTLHDGQQKFLIGSRFKSNFGSQYMYNFSGSIDDVSIWNRTLTEQEITALYTGISYIAPCADPTACNFEQEGECVFAEPYLDCSGNCQQDANNNGICDQLEAIGAQLCGEGTVWDNATGTCIGFDPCPADFNNSGVVEVADLLLFLAIFGENCD